MNIYDFGFDANLNKPLQGVANPIVYDQFSDSSQSQLSSLRALASNMQLFDAVVDKGGNGNYTSLKTALAQGKTRIFIRNGTYSEDSIMIPNANTVIVGESYLGVAITFTDINYGISINANGFICSRLNIRGTQASTVALVSTNGDKTGCAFLDCTFSKAKTYIVDAFTNGSNGSQINFSNCTFEGAGMSTGTSALRGLYLSNATGCTFNLDVAGGLQESVLLDRPRGVSIVGCSIIGDYVVLATNVATLSVVSQNIINVRNLFCATTNFTGNYVFANADSGGVSATRKLFVVDGASRVSGNYFEMNYATRKIFDIGNFTMVSGNIFIGGSLADITGEGVSYSGNFWDTTAAANSTFTLTAASTRCVYGDSIIRGPSNGGGYTLTFTDSGVSNVVSADKSHYLRA